MTALDGSVLVDRLELHDELRASVDERTLRIIERRERSSTVRGRGWIVRRALVTADLFGLAVALVVPALVFGIGGAPSNRIGELGECAVFLAALPFWALAAKLYGLYDKDEERANHSTADECASVFQLVTIMCWLLFAVTRWTPVAHPAFGKVFTFWLLAATLIPLFRACGRAYCRTRIDYLQNTLIVGAGEAGQRIARKVLHHPEYGVNLVGFLDSDPTERGEGLGHLALLGGVERLHSVVRLLDVERVILAFSREPDEQLLPTVRELQRENVQVDIVPRLFELVGSRVDLHSVEGFPLLGLAPAQLARSSRFLKRALDVVGASLGLLVLVPFFVLVAVAVKLDSRGPVLFRQRRVGSGGTSFEILKLRTMTEDAERRKREVAHLNRHLANGGDGRMFKIEGDPRVTRVGRLLRRFSLDELPQLWNVLRGEMSLVGPRPLIPEEHAHVSEWAERRLDLRPGITGLWQVLGRHEIGFDDMVRLDYSYVTSWSLGQDLRLLLRTAPRVVRSSTSSC